MDEIIIEEKRYVSSKRAAKMTGYAKDYVGQLCREGRVPARLVGRSWYVLESAIQDHRFGNQETEQKEVRTINPDTEYALTEKWGAPRYESAQTETLMPLNGSESREDGDDLEEDQKNIHNSWREWFDRIEESKLTVEGVEPIETLQDAVSETETLVDDTHVVEEDEVIVPVRVLRQSIPREFLPLRETAPVMRSLQEEVVKISSTSRRRDRRFTLTIQALGAVIAVASVTLAAIGSGYFDSYVASDNRVSLISGVILYDK